MPAEIIIANPIHKRKRRSHRRRPMTALQRKYFGPRRSRSRITRARRNPTPLSAAPPRRRGRVRHYARRIAGRARRNFSEAGIGNLITTQLLPASIGAAGALALDVAWPYIPVPTFMQGSAFAPLLRIGGAMAIGWGATAIMGRKFGREVANGAMVVTLYDIGKEYLASALPAPTAALPAPAAASGAGVYVPGLGWYSAAQAAGMGVYAP
jgi:hypothetical protein